MDAATPSLKLSELLLASYPLTKDYKASAGKLGAMTVEDVPIKDGSCYLNGKYNKYKLNTPVLPNFDAGSFGVSVEFKPEAESYWIVVGGRGYFWFGLEVVDGRLRATLNNQKAKSELAGEVAVGKWHTVSACVDISKRSVEVVLDGKPTIRWKLSAGFALEVARTGSSDGFFTFTNYSNGGVFKGSVKNLRVFGPPGKSSTKANEDGGHTQTIFLDRHKVMAPANKVLTGFGLRRPTTNTIRYEFSHVAPHHVGATKKSCTKWNDEDAAGGYRSIYLDRHKVMAPDGHFLAGFQLKRNGKGQYRYEFWTRKAAMGATKEARTKANDWGNGAVIYLDRHMFKVPKDCALRGFQLYRPTGTKIAYRYWFATIE